LSPSATNAPSQRNVGHHHHHNKKKKSQDSVCNAVIRLWDKNTSFLRSTQTGSGAQPNLYSVGTKGSFPGEKAAGPKADFHLRLLTVPEIYIHFTYALLSYIITTEYDKSGRATLWMRHEVTPKMSLLALKPHDFKTPGAALFKDMNA
jgi:hypothetical protein